MSGSSLSLTGELAARYVIESELGTGATSTVYLARDTAHDRPVAIKLLRRELAESLSLERFLREIRTTARLRHSHIVPILDSGLYEGRPYCVLPYMEGGTLRQRLERHRQLPIDDVLTIGIHVARALESAHLEGIIHRDVKPENILFSGGEASLADFGIAKALEGAVNESTTSTGIVRGTPAYMSPEQASGERAYDGRSDVYSLGCVLYEMIAGVPVFVGPTAQSVLAQRLTRAPQPVRVYRPLTPVALQTVLHRALAVNPADRYQTAGELAVALERARSHMATAIPGAESDESSVAALVRRHAVALAGLLVVLAVASYEVATRSGAVARAASLDTTRIAVFAIDPKPGPLSESASGALLRAALRRWQELAVVPQDETVDAMRRRRVDAASPASVWATVAADLGAGRFVVSRISPSPTGRTISAEYRDGRAGLLYLADVSLPSDSSRVADAYRALADSLLLRGASDERAPTTGDQPHHLFAMQAFIRGLAARSEWNLARADSMFARATEIEPSFARAHLWLAQVRLWRSLRNDRWASSAERAAGDSVGLTTTERAMAAALVALLHHEYARACERYGSLVAADSQSFVGWYGLGDCAERDNLVVRDARSPSGWRFRSSYYRAIKAYARAFELLPATYHGFHAGGYSRLRELLYTSARALRRGASADSGGRDFLARARLSGDTIAMIPFERDRILAGDPRAVVSPGAVDMLRSIFHQIASRWTAAFPNSPEAKEAIAISLELQADRAAVDSLRAAARLSTDPLQRLRFVGTGVILQVKFGIPDDLRGLDSARRTADSLLRAHASPSRDEAAILAPLAALTGHCDATASMLRSLAQPFAVLGTEISQDIVSDAYVLKADRAMGCPTPALLTVDRVAARIDATVSAEDRRLMMQYYLLAAAVDPDVPSDSATISRLATLGDNVLVATASVLSGDPRSARAALERSANNRRRSMLGDFTPDAALPEARLMLRLGDTLSAIHVLESTLASARAYAPLATEGASNNVVFAASLANAMALRAHLSARTDVAAARRWSKAALTLLSGADAALQPNVRSLTLIAGR